MGNSPKIGKQIINSLTQFISPNICVVCNELIQSENYKFDFLCNVCFKKIPFFNQNEDLTTRQILGTDSTKISINLSISLISTHSDSNYFHLIHQLKYQNHRIIGLKLGEELAKFMIKNQFPEFDLILPIPLHPAKKRERGYNQSDFIAKGISNIYNIPFSTKAVTRFVYTESQTLSKSDIERYNNIKNAFKVVNGGLIQNKNILICDDVFTTGSTLNSLATELKESGAKQIYTATIIATKSYID